MLLVPWAVIDIDQRSHYRSIYCQKMAVVICDGDKILDLLPIYGRICETKLSTKPLMSRTERLFDLIQTLRIHRFPVTGSHLAQELGISVRTLYRDIATLKAQGADIEGEPGLGYVLRPGFMLPPLIFTEEEIEALVLGSR